MRKPWPDEFENEDEYLEALDEYISAIEEWEARQDEKQEEGSYAKY